MSLQEEKDKKNGNIDWRKIGHYINGREGVIVKDGRLIIASWEEVIGYSKGDKGKKNETAILKLLDKK